MRDNKYFRSTHAVVTINLDTKAIQEINKIKDPGLKIIHVFVTDINKVRIDALKVFAGTAPENRIKVVLHCLNKKVRFDLRKELKGVPKGKFFHTNLMGERFCMKLSPNKSISIHREPLKITLKEGDNMQVIWLH